MWWSLGLTILGAVAGGMLGAWFSGQPLGAVAGVPPLFVGLWQTWRAHQREARQERELAELRARPVAQTAHERDIEYEQRKRRDVSQAIARGHTDGFG